MSPLQVPINRTGEFRRIYPESESLFDWLHNIGGDRASQIQQQWNCITTSIPAQLVTEFTARLTDKNTKQVTAAFLELHLCCKLSANGINAQLISGTGHPDLKITHSNLSVSYIEIKTKWDSTTESADDKRLDKLCRDTYGYMRAKNRYIFVDNASYTTRNPSPKKFAVWIDQQVPVPISALNTTRKATQWVDPLSGWKLELTVVETPTSDTSRTSVLGVHTSNKAVIVEDGQLDKMWRKISRQHPSYGSELIPAVMWNATVSYPDTIDLNNYFLNRSNSSHLIWIHECFPWNPNITDPMLYTKDPTSTFAIEWPYPKTDF